jgi:mono/diheme cytochrome c family protein
MNASAVRAALVAVALAGLAATPAKSADAANGERLAKRWCASCHVITADQPVANADAPSFASIARRPSFNPAQLAYLLLTPHPVMPELALTRVEADDIVAYIARRRR